MSEKNANLDELNDIDNLLDDDLEEWEGITGLGNLKKKKIKLNKLNKFFIWLIIFLIIIFWLIYSVFYYFQMTLSNSRNSFWDMYLKYVNQYVLSNFISLNIWDNKTFDNNNKDTFKRAQDMNNYIIDPWVIFYKKKDEKNKFLSKSLVDITKKLKDIDTLKQNIVKYKYINEWLTNIIQNNRIMPILITLNAIKIYFTDYVFIKINDFDDKILNTAIQSKSDSNSKLTNFISLYRSVFNSYVKEDIKKFWEEWVKIYLTNITFNYMYNNNDNWWINIWSSVFITQFKNKFEKELNYRYNQIVNKWFDIDKDKFKKEYINLFAWIYWETKDFLDNSEINLLPINIRLLSYDAKDEKLSFTIKLLIWTDNIRKTNWKVTTIWLATDMISLLRQSRLIIWKNIKADKMKVSKKTMKIWWKQIFKEMITLNFSTSVQSKVNVEITDIEK